MQLKHGFIIEIMLLCFMVAISCNFSPRDLKAARIQANYDFYHIMFEDRVDTKYFDGPFFVEEGERFYTFNWVSNIPRVKPTIIEGYVPKDRKHKSSFRTLEQGAIGLSGTLDYPLSEATLYSLFALPLNNSPGVLRLRKVPLTLDQLEDVHKITIIGVDISNYTYCFNCAYPDSLSWLKNIREGRYGKDCNVRELDSLNTHDRYGREYYYENFIKFVVLGTPGANGKWDFTPAIMDTIYKDNKEHIYTNGDDIIVKLIPKSLGCD